MPIFELQHPDGRSFEVDAPDMNAAAGAISSLGQAANPAAAQQPAAQPYSLGPLSDITELGARGINAGVQSVGRITGLDVGQPRAPQPLGQPFNLPGIGRPSITGTAGALAEGAVSGATLPGDVYTGKVDPLSNQGIKRATDLAAMTPLSAVPSSVVRAPAAALPAVEVKKAATTVMDKIRDEARAIPIEANSLENLAKDISEYVSKNGPSVKNAEKAHAAIDDIAKPSRPITEAASAPVPLPSGKISAAEYQNYIASQSQPTKKPSVVGDMGDLIDSRQALMEIVRTGKGQNKAAAKMAVDQIDLTLAKQVSPKVVGQIKEADKNYAIALAASKQEKGITNAIEEAGNAGTGGNVGNKIRQAVEKDLKKGRDKGYLTPEVQAAMEGVTKPGWAVNSLRPLAAFDPTHSKLGAMYTMLPHLSAGALTGGKSLALSGLGYGARAMYDRIMTERAAKISNAMRAQSPAAIANPGAPGGIFAGQRAPDLAQLGILNLGIKPGDSGY